VWSNSSVSHDSVQTCSDSTPQHPPATQVHMVDAFPLINIYPSTPNTSTQ
jgi:hypothetical protein